MDVTPMPFKRKYENIHSHEHENCRAIDSKEKQRRFKFDMCDKPADADEDFVQYLTGEMMSIRTDYEYEVADDDFVQYLTSDMISISTDDNCKGVNDDTGDNDPHYEIFLSSLKVHGNSYVLEVSEKNGLFEPLKYNAESEFDDELDQDNWSEMKIMTGGNVEDDDSCRVSKVENPKVFSSLPKNRRKDSVIENDTRSENQIYSVVPFGNHQVLVEECKSQSKIAMRGGCGEDHIDGILRNEGEKSEGKNSEEAANIEKKKNNEVEVDDEYQFYYNSLSNDGYKLILKYKDAPPLVYEGDSREDNTTYSINGNTKLFVYAEQSNASKLCFPIIEVEEDDSCQYLGSPNSERPSMFREQVMRILRKPFDEKEHQMLAKAILAQKPMDRNIDLRFGRDQSYSINKYGKSYLDYYYDLKRKLLAAKNSYEELILLRGFFFWLQNLTQEGAFKPWLDASCLALYPQAQ